MITCTRCNSSREMETLIWSDSGEIANIANLLSDLGVFHDYVEFYRCLECGIVVDKDNTIASEYDEEYELEELNFDPDHLSWGED